MELDSFHQNHLKVLLYWYLFHSENVKIVFILLIVGRIVAFEEVLLSNVFILLLRKIHLMDEVKTLLNCWSLRDLRDFFSNFFVGYNPFQFRTKSNWRSWRQLHDTEDNQKFTTIFLK